MPTGLKLDDAAKPYSFGHIRGVSATLTFRAHPCRYLIWRSEYYEKIASPLRFATSSTQKRAHFIQANRSRGVFSGALHKFPLSVFVRWVPGVIPTTAQFQVRLRFASKFAEQQNPRKENHVRCDEYNKTSFVWQTSGNFVNPF